MTKVDHLHRTLTDLEGKDWGNRTVLSTEPRAKHDLVAL